MISKENAANTRAQSHQNYQGKALEQERKGQIHNALTDYKKALEFWPDDIKTQHKIGLLLSHIGDYAQAEQYLSPLLGKSAGFSQEEEIDLLEALASCQLELGKFKLAIERLQELELLETKRAFPCILQALAFESLGEHTKALKHYQQALQREPEQQNPDQAAQIWHNLGTLYHYLGKTNEAESAFNQALKLNVNQSETQNNFQLIEETGQTPKEQRNKILQFLLSHPDHSNKASLLCHIGKLSGLLNQATEAIEAFDWALKSSFYLEPIYNQLAAFLLSENQSEYAWFFYQLAYKQALQRAQYPLIASEEDPKNKLNAWLKTCLNPSDNKIRQPQFNALLSQITSDLPDTTEITPQIPTGFNALQDQLQSLSVLDLSLDQINSLSGLAGVLAQQKHHPQALQLIQSLIEKRICNTTLACQYASLAKTGQDQQQAIDYIQDVMTNLSLSQDAQKTLSFHLGKLYDKVNQTDQAFNYLRQANALKKTDFSPSFCLKETQAFIDTFDPDLIQKLPKGSSSDKLIFIVGMPRSGTTLTEQIICSHSQVYGAGELGFLLKSFHHLMGSMPLDPVPMRERLRSCTESDIRNAANLYLEHLQAIVPQSHTGLIIDKMPSNFRLLGLIEILFPNATIIHCQRHPLDICFSCFSLDFIHLDFTYNLEHIGLYFQQYQKMMQHWKQTLSIPIIDIYYEDLIHDPETSSKALIKACHLNWDQDCLSFYKNPRHVRTASAQQVIQPIYTSSLKRHKKYLKHLAPLLEWITLPDKYLE